MAPARTLLLLGGFPGRGLRRARRAFRPGCWRWRLARGFQPGRALDDLREHRAGVAAGGGPMRNPHGRRVLGEDVLEIAVALDAARRELGDVDVAGPVVAML